MYTYVIYIYYTHIICVIMFIYAQIDPIDPIPIYRDDLLHDIFEYSYDMLCLFRYMQE